MAFMSWSAGLHGVDVDFADKEHQILFDRLNRLYELVENAADKAEIGKHLDDLLSFVIEHFKHEEDAMQEKGYESYQAHKMEHDALLETCKELQAQFHAGEIEITEDRLEMLKDWLEDHIPMFDMAYTTTLNSD